MKQWKHFFPRDAPRYRILRNRSIVKLSKGFPYPARDPTSVFTAATTSKRGGQNTNRMHRALFDTSTSWSSIKFALSKNNCEREYWLCRDYKWSRRGRNARSSDLPTYFVDKKYSLDGVFTSFQNLLVLSTIRTINNLSARDCFSFALKYYSPSWTNWNIIRFNRIKTYSKCISYFSKFHYRSHLFW